MVTAWFVDGAYVFKVWQSLHRPDGLDYHKLRDYLVKTVCGGTDEIEEAYYFNSDPDPPTAQMNAFHNMLAFPAPSGPGLRVKLYWLHKRKLWWPGMMGGGPVLHPTTGEQFEQITQKGVDVGLIFHLMRSYSKRHWTKLVLAAGDSDFYEPVQHLVENEGVELILLGTLSTISSELRPYARSVIEIDHIANQVSRPMASTSRLAPGSPAKSAGPANSKP